MLELIGTPGYETMSKPSPEALEVLSRVMREVERPVVAEIGVGIGATTQAFCQKLNAAELHLYDFEDRLQALLADLDQAGLTEGIDIVAHGNGRQTFNSYAWTLARQHRAALRGEATLPRYDLVYLDGAHMFQHDAPAAALLREQIKPGGYIVFDDMHWSFNRSKLYNPETRPELREQYSEDQLDTPHVELVVATLIATDPRFEQVFLTKSRKPYRAVYRRMSARRRWLRAARRGLKRLLGRG